MGSRFSAKWLLITLVGVSAVSIGTCDAWAKDDGTNCRDVLVGVEKRYTGYDSWRVLNVTITSSNGGEKTRRVVTAHQNIGLHRRTRSMVLAPAELRGHESMIHDHAGDHETDRVWTYLPSQQKVHAMNSPDLSNRVFGSDLSVGEMMTRRAVDYDCKFLGTDTYKGLPVWKIWVNPRTEREVIRLGLRDGELWVTQNTFLPVRSTFNADAPTEQRVFTADNIHWTDGVQVPGLFKVATRKEGRVISTSVFEVETERYNANLPTDWFKVEDLGNTTSGWNDWLLGLQTN